MHKVVIAIFLVLIAVGAYAWFSVRALPSWFDDTSEIQLKQGVVELLGDKITAAKNGQVHFSEAEFNAIFYASLASDEEGQNLLQVSDAVRVFLHADELELTAIINLNKVEDYDPNARRAIEKFDRIFPFVNDDRVALTIFATPVVKDGRVGIKDDFHIKVGELPFSNDTLRGLGVDVERANSTLLPLKYLRVLSLKLQDQNIALKVSPEF